MNKIKYDHRICTGTMDNAKKRLDEQAMVDGLEAELVEKVYNVLPTRKEIVDGLVSHLSLLIDARIDLDRVHRNAVKNIKMKEPVFLRDDVQEYETVNSEPEPKPAFIPLTEYKPTTIRNGDRFNVSPSPGANMITFHVVIEKDFIPGLREIKVQPFEGYTPVEPGCPFDDYEEQAMKNKK